jgi:hypothetical protein
MVIEILNPNATVAQAAYKRQRAGTKKKFSAGKSPKQERQRSPAQLPEFPFAQAGPTSASGALRPH